MSLHIDNKSEVICCRTTLDKLEVDDKSNATMANFQNDNCLPTQKVLEKTKQLGSRNASEFNLIEVKIEYSSTRNSLGISPLDLQLKREAMPSVIDVKMENFFEISGSACVQQNPLLSQLLCSKKLYRRNELASKEIKMEICNGTLFQEDKKITSQLNHNEKFGGRDDSEKRAEEPYEGHIMKSELMLTHAEKPETLRLPSEASNAHPESSPRKGKLTVTESLWTPKLTNKEQDLHYCTVCVKSYTKKRSLQRHMLTHTKKKSHKCSVCQKTFIHKCGLDRHILTHTANKPHECYICKRTFAEKYGLQTHMYSHTGQRPHECDLCKKTFTQNYRLLAHMLTHTGERPYKCDICQKAFTHKFKLSLHMSTHTGQRPHKCDVCQRTFIKKYALREHMLTHTEDNPFKCYVCKKKFTKHYLRVHILLHTGEKPYKCDVCQKQFSRKYTLSTHMISHTGQRHHKCDVCENTFSLKSNLHKHMLTHTK